MATIPNQGTELRHVRKTITFDGGANNGLLGDQIPVFTATGTVFIERLTVFVTENLACAASSTTQLIFELTGSGTLAHDGINANGNTSFRQWGSPNQGEFYALGDNILPNGQAIDRDYTLAVYDNGGGADVTNGTIVIDAWYRPISDDGALAGDDIDESWRDHFWGKAMTELSAVPAITASAFDAVRWLFTLARNKITQTSTTQTLRNDADNASIATSTVGDDGTTFTRGEWN